jgi:large subunit ribosomal protein L6
MSRVAKKPISIPKGVEVSLVGNLIKVKGSKGELAHQVHEYVAIDQHADSLEIKVGKEDSASWAQAGTVRALIKNMVVGVSEGFEKKLQLNGVGYRAEASGNSLNLTLGFSHPVVFQIPTDLQITTPSQTEIVVRGVDKQQVGQAAADIRSFRPPEPYKGKGVRYSNEQVRRKEAKKK